MDVASLVRDYGYPAVFVGTFLEGETILLAAAFAAHRGLLNLPWVIALAAGASFLGDQTFFWLGRRHGPALIARLPGLATPIERALGLLRRYNLPVIVSVRFLYGLRIAGPIAIGMSGVDWRRFLILNLLGAMVWAVAIGFIGYGAGSGLAYLMDDVQGKEEWILAAILLAGMLAWLARHAVRRLRRRQ
jgi:membrane protein DedA with SNARE-associated domain